MLLTSDNQALRKKRQSDSKAPQTNTAL